MSKKLIVEIGQDLQSAGGGPVVYLEGKTDPPILLALLGASGERETSRGVLYQGVLIRGLDPGGSSAVEQRLRVAREAKSAGIFGVLDGDGRPLRELIPEFDGPHAGPQFRWKGFCIENLLARATWPEPWGVMPDWRAVLTDFAPYVAINRLRLELSGRLQRLDLSGSREPNYGRPLVTRQAFIDKLRAGKHELAGLEIEAMFSAELDSFLATLEGSVDEAQAVLNGKWLVDVFASQRMKRTQAQCRDEWTAYLRSIGGDPEIKAWWGRTFAR